MNSSHQKFGLFLIITLSILTVFFGLYFYSRGNKPQTINSKAAGNNQPNIVFILTDDQAMYDSQYDPNVMPNLKSQMIDQGLFFSRFYLNIGLCCPSRAAILRGQYAHNTGIFGNAPPNGGFETFYNNGSTKESSTVATWLHNAGYKTVLMGKYLNGYPNTASATYVPPGWDEWYGRDFSKTNNSCKQVNDEYDYSLVEKGPNEQSAKSVPYGCSSSDYWTDVIATQATGFIQRQTASNKPFFMYIAPHVPHLPATPPDRYKGLFLNAKVPRTIESFNETDVSDKPNWVKALPSLNSSDIAQLDSDFGERLRSLKSADDLIKVVIDTLQQTGKLNNTYVVFMSDNGFHMGFHRMGEGKDTAYEEDINVPLVIRGPGVQQGRTVDGLAVNADIAPTFAELAGATPTSAVDGRSLVPLLQGSSPSNWRTAVLLENSGSVQTSPQQALKTLNGEEPDIGKVIINGADRVGSLKGGTSHPPFSGIRTKDELYVKYDTGEEEYYNLRTDPYELSNGVGQLSSQKKQQLLNQATALSACNLPGKQACYIADGGGATITTTPPTGTVTPTIPVTPGAGVSLALKLAFQGITQISGSQSMQVAVSLLSSDGTTTPGVGTFTTDGSTKNTLGNFVFIGTVTFPTSSPSSGYSVIVKGPRQLAKKVCVSVPTETEGGSYSCGVGQISLSSGTNSLDFSGILMLAGDLPAQDGIVSSYDLSFLRNNLCNDDHPTICTDPGVLSVGDVDLDGRVTTRDYSLVLSSISIKPDEQ